MTCSILVSIYQILSVYPFPKIFTFLSQNIKLETALSTKWLNTLRVPDFRRTFATHQALKIYKKKWTFLVYLSVYPPLREQKLRFNPKKTATAGKRTETLLITRHGRRQKKGRKPCSFSLIISWLWVSQAPASKSAHFAHRGTDASGVSRKLEDLSRHPGRWEYLPSKWNAIAVGGPATSKATLTVHYICIRGNSWKRKALHCLP